MWFLSADLANLPCCSAGLGAMVPATVGIQTAAKGFPIALWKLQMAPPGMHQLAQRIIQGCIECNFPGLKTYAIAQPFHE
jgi:hypothetical protein